MIALSLLLVGHYRIAVSGLIRSKLIKDQGRHREAVA